MKLSTLVVVLVAYAAVYAQLGIEAVCASPAKIETEQDEKQKDEINSADRVFFWVGLKDVVSLTDEQLDLWKSRGVDGFLGVAHHLKGMGGAQDFTGDPQVDLNAKNYDLQRSIRDSKIVERAKARGIKLYLGCYLVNYFNTATPLQPWFNDEEWANVVIPRIRDFAAAAKLLGFDGIVFDQELYPQTGKVVTATWDWNYPGNTHTEPEVRAKVRQRGQQLMQAILEGYPQVEIVLYHYDFPGTWTEIIQKVVNKIEKSAGNVVFIDWLDGLSSVEGYGAIRFINADFYKGPHVGTWEPALQYQSNSLYSLFSRRLSNWSYASSRVFESPFSWIDSGGSGWADARAPAYVAEQLAAFRKWGMGGEFANYAHRGLQGFDYTPYVSAIQSASQPAVVDSEPPHLMLIAPTNEPPYETTETALDINGYATDNLTIRVVRWSNDRGGSGAAQMTWKIKSGDARSGWNWQMDWMIKKIPLQTGVNRIVITAEDIKGLTNSQTIVVRKK